MEISELPKDKKIILFDGVCNLCDSMVQYVIARDKKDVFRFASLQSEIGKKILTHIGVDIETTNSGILYQPGIAYYIKSNVAIEVARELGWPISAWFLGFIPKFLRDPMYNYVARNRYKWYGKKDSCMLPSKEMEHKFL